MTKMDVPFLAPGCFGSALNFNASGMVCAACPFKADCEPAHQASLTALRSKLGIKVEEKKTTKSERVQVDEPEDRLALPKKVRQLLARIDRSDLNIVENIKAGFNPFKDVPSMRFMHIACHLVMNLDVPVNHKIISVGLMKSMGWSKGTADAHARMAAQALQHVGAIQNTDGVFSVVK